VAEDPAAVDRRPRCAERPAPGRPGAATVSAAGASLPRGRACRPAPLTARSASDGASPPGAVARACLLIGLFACAHPATAQLSPAPADLPVGEGYRLELLGSLWPPAQDLTLAGRGSGGTTSAEGGTGASAPRFLDLRMRLRLSRRQRVHLDYLPVRYPAGTVLDDRPAPGDAGDGPGVPVASTLTWKTWRVAYEVDVIHLARGSLGLFAEAGYTDVRVALDGAGARCDTVSPACEPARLRRPVPGLGGVVRLYPSPVIMLGAEASLLRTVPGIDRILGHAGRHLAYDVHAALNFVEAFGLQLGYRSRRLQLETADYDADLRLEGVYVGALLRF